MAIEHWSLRITGWCLLAYDKLSSVLVDSKAVLLQFDAERVKPIANSVAVLVAPTSEESACIRSEGNDVAENL